MTMLTFYNRGKIFGEVALKDLISDSAIRMRRTESHYRWGEYLGLDEEGRYAVRTAVGQVIRFDMASGKPVR